MGDEGGGAGLEGGGLGVDGRKRGLEGGENGESGVCGREEGIAGGQVRIQSGVEESGAVSCWTSTPQAESKRGIPVFIIGLLEVVLELTVPVCEVQLVLDFAGIL